MFHRHSYVPQNDYLNLPTEFRNMFFLRKQKLPLFLVCDDKWVPDFTKSFKFSFLLYVFLILVLSFFPCSHNDYMFIIESEQTLGDSEGQRCQACCSPQDHKESEKTEQLNKKNATFSQSTCIIYILSDEFFLKDLFIYFWLRWVFLAARRLSLVSVREGQSLLAVSSCLVGMPFLVEHRFYGQELQQQQYAGSVVLALGLQIRVSTCGPLAQLPLCLWAIPKAGIKLVSTALAGGFSTADHQQIPISNEFSKVSFKLVILMTNSLNFSLKMALYS